MKLRRIAALFFALALALVTLTVPAAAIEDIEIEATAVLLLDGESEAVLYEENAHARRYPASTTKIMTALLVLEAIDRGELRFEQEITATATAATAAVIVGNPIGVDGCGARYGRR